jgi:hypothetical protein
MAIQNDFYIDYQNRLIAHATITVNYDNRQDPFHVGATVTSTSGGTAVIVNDTDSGGNAGILDLVYVSGTFANNDTLVDDFPNDPGTADQDGDTVIKTAVYTARQLYSFLQDTFDELVQMDDTVPMQAQTPTEFTLINGWFIDDESVKYLSAGAIDTFGYEDEIRLLSFLSAGYTEAVITDIGKGVTQAGTTDTGVLLHYNNATRKWWVRMDAADDLFDGTTPTTHTVSVDSGTGEGDLSVASVTGEDLYSNVYTLGTIATDPNPRTYIFQDSESLEGWWGRGDSLAHIDVLIKATESGEEIGDGSITAFVRHFGDLFDHFNIAISTRGRYAVPLASGTDLNNIERGEITVEYETLDGGEFTPGNFIRDETTGAYGEILADDEINDILTIGNVILGTGGSGDFTAGNGISETTDGLEGGDTGVTAAIVTAGVTSIVRGYNDIKILFVNATVLFTSGSTEPSVGERIFQGGGALNSDPVGFYLGSTLSSGTWAGGDAAGTMYIANWNSVSFSGATALNGATAGADFATCSGAETVTSDMNKNFEQGSSYPYNVIVECAGRTMAEVYEWFKYVTREAANSTQLPESPENNPPYATMFRVFEGSIVEEDGEEYIAAQATYTSVKASPFGTLAGGKLFGARGVWLEGMATADRQNFQLIDANSNTRTPPNFITITVNSVISGDKVSVFRTSSGSTINKAQFTSGAGNTAGSGAFVVTGTNPIPSDTPNYGYLRVVDFSDTSTLRESRYAYSSWSNTTNSFTLSGSTTLDRTYVDGEDTAYVPYYDEVAGNTSVYVTVIYSADQSVLTRVRRYGGTGDSILPFQISGSVGTTGYTVAAIRTPDSIVA